MKPVKVTRVYTRTGDHVEIRMPAGADLARYIAWLQSNEADLAYLEWLARQEAVPHG